MLFCPEKALNKKQREIGKIEWGISEQVTALTGCLNTGEVSGVPIIKEMVENLPQQETIVIDCPPGSACVVMESIKEADFCVLVAEPTLFGVHNLAMVYELVKLFDKPFGVILNKCLSGENPSEQFCREKQIQILAQIPYDKELGRLNANGHVAVRESEQYRNLFCHLLHQLKKGAQL